MAFLTQEVTGSNHAVIWCMGLVRNCTLSEIIGLWSVIAFYSTVLIVTFVHLIIQENNGSNRSSSNNSISSSNSNNITSQERDALATRREHVRATCPTAASTRTTTSSRRRSIHDGDNDDDYTMMFWLLVYFFILTFGCLIWVLSNGQWVHPRSCWQIQLFGSILLVACCVGFVLVHIDLGNNWSPTIVNESEPNQILITTGIYSFARHPMYAIFLWAMIGTFLSTLNWVITWCVSGSVVVMLSRIRKEERMLLQNFGQDYVQYQKQIPALGFPWQYILSYDQEYLLARKTEQRQRRRQQQLTNANYTPLR